jgi:AcrR family transcriptional regulator
VSLSPHRPKAAPRTGIEARRERQREEARRAILDATEALLTESEGGDFSIRGLAEKCGYSAPTVYYHFGDKDGLISALLEDGMQTLAAALERSCRALDPLERLRSMRLAFIRYSTENPVFSGLWWNVSRRPGNDMPPSFGQVREHLDTTVSALIAGGRLNGLDKTSAEQMLWVLLHGLVGLQNAEPDHPWAPGLAESAIDALLRGMTLPPTAEPTR